jgi:beta-galactosidase
MLPLAMVILWCSAGVSAQTAPRERISINMDWRFMKDTQTPTGPGYVGGRGGRGGGAPPTVAPDADKLAYANIKDWMMSNGEDLVLDPAAAKHARPAGNLGADVPQTRADFNDSSWRQLNLPHDWGIEGPFDPAGNGGTGKLPFFGVSWYRKHLQIPAADAGKQIYLDIDGAMSYPNVWCNGQYAGGWGYGYSSFRIDLTPYIKTGAENVLSIRVDNPPNSSRWYPGGGIYRNVWLVKTQPVHVGHWGTYVTTPQVSPSSSTVSVKVTVDNDGKSDAATTVRTQVFPIDINDQRTGPAVASSDAAALNVAAGKNGSAENKITVANPKLWSNSAPNRYVAVTTVETGGRVVDSYETPFGIRKLTFDPKKGVLINDVAMKLNGVCDHADLGALGTVSNVRGFQRQLEILKEMGGNAIRTSHNPPAPELLDVADKMGFVVMDEMFDCWANQKTPNDYHYLFPDWSEKDARMLIRRDRNHPSVIMWSIGNEIGEADSPAGFEIAKRLGGICHDEDPTRPVTSARNSYNSGFNGYQDLMDVFGFNYLRNQSDNFQMYIAFRDAHPEKMVFSSESASCISTRGEYLFPPMDQFYNKGGGGTPDGQMSSYDLYAPNWACPPDWEWHAEDLSGVAAGEFVWTGFDYLGEPTRNGGGGGGGRGGARGARGAATGPADATAGAPATAPAPGARRGGGFAGGAPGARSSYFGIIDLAGFPKDRYYLYQSRWRPDLPMAHILPHWNWADRVGQVTPVMVYTSGDEGELFLNGKSLGRHKKGEHGVVQLNAPTTAPAGGRGFGGGGAMYKIDNYRLIWDDVVYEPGELKVVTYKNGKEWATATMKTTGPASKVALKPDRSTIANDGADLSFVTVSVADNSGAMVPRSMNTLKFEVSGPGEIVAVDNGDPNSMVPFQSKEMKAFNGLCLVIVRAKPGQSGTITLRATSEGLAAGETPITAK